MKVLIVQSRPYQTFAGGDGAYTNALIRHLDGSGCSVVGITSGSTKGRPRPLLSMAYHTLPPSAWQFRSTFRIGRHYLALSPQMLRDAIAFLRERQRAQAISPFAVVPDAVEKAWIGKILQNERPDLAILMFEAAGAVDVVREYGIPHLALVGFLPIRNYVLSENLEEDSARTGAAEFLKSITQAQLAGFSSRDDCNFAREFLKIDNPVYVGMGFAQQSLRTKGRSSIVLFVGNKTEPNREAIEWFRNGVWPIVRALVPEARFRIVGRVSQYFTSDGAAGIECVGEVASLDAEYCDARVVVAPLTIGSAGVKTKVAEAISFGCPLVATSLGVDGGDTGQMDEAAMIADDQKSFADKVIALLTDEALWREKQQGTARVFEKLFSRAAAYAELDDLIASIRSRPMGRVEK